MMQLFIHKYTCNICQALLKARESRNFRKLNAVVNERVVPRMSNPKMSSLSQHLHNQSQNVEYFDQLALDKHLCQFPNNASTTIPLLFFTSNCAYYIDTFLTK